MPAKCSRFGSTLRLTPCSVTQCFTRTPMLAILAPRTKMPTWPGRRSPSTPSMRKRGDQPVLERADERPHVAAAPREVEHHIGHALARAVIGEAAAAPGLEDGKAIRRQQLGGIGAGASRVDGGVLEQPDAVLSLPPRDRGYASIHEGNGLGVRHRLRARQPFDLGRRMWLACKGGYGHERFDFQRGSNILG